MSSKDIPAGYKCEACGTEHKFPAYVFAHWDISIVHTCACGAKHDIQAGVATLIHSQVTRATNP